MLLRSFDDDTNGLFLFMNDYLTVADSRRFFVLHHHALFPASLRLIDNELAALLFENAVASSIWLKVLITDATNGLRFFVIQFFIGCIHCGRVTADHL